MPPSTPRPRPVVRVAGGVVGLVGLANVVLGALALTTGWLRLDDATAVTLAVLGVLTLALGVLVATARRWAMVVALVVFGALFAVQAFSATGGAPAPAVITLAVVLLPLVLALRSTRRPDASQPPPPDVA